MASCRPVKEGVFAVRLYPAELTPLYERCEKLSQEKLLEEFKEIAVIPAMQGGGWDVYNGRSKSWYFVTCPPEVTCTCPHWQTRLSVIGTPCKHILAVKRQGFLDTELELTA